MTVGFRAIGDAFAIIVLLVFSVLFLSLFMIGCTVVTLVGSDNSRVDINTHAPISTESDDESLTETNTTVGDTSSEISSLNKRLTKAEAKDNALDDRIDRGKARGEELKEDVKGVEKDFEQLW